MTTITIPRTGDMPLEFEGEALASASSRGADGHCATRWHDLALFQAASGAFIVQMGFRTAWRCESSHDQVFVADSLDTAIDYVGAAALPVEILGSYPFIADNEQRKAKIEGEVVSRLTAAATELVRQARKRVAPVKTPSPAPRSASFPTGIAVMAFG